MYQRTIRMQLNNKILYWTQKLSKLLFEMKYWTVADYMKSKVGAARGIRTPDPVITNDVLYQLSYCGERQVVWTAP